MSGPMTCLPGLNFAAYHAMTTNLRAGSHNVTNPAELNPEGGSWTDYMRRDIAALMKYSSLATLPGWEHSKRARLEVLIVERLGMTVVNAHDLVTMEFA